MDTSRLYIEMCKKAEEIQAYRDNTFESKKDVGQYKRGKYKLMELGDYFYDPVMGNSLSFGIAYPNSVFLPRQDQLQEMLDFPVGTFKDNFWTALSKLGDWAFEEKFIKYIPESMEQLWLCFVMNEKYNKSWNGKEWINEQS